MYANQAQFPVAIMATILGVFRSGFYARQQRLPSARAVADAKLTGEIKAIHDQSGESYGAPRIHAELAANSARSAASMSDANALKG